MAWQVTHPAREPEGVKEAPGEGVFVHGLFLDGCAWSNRENRLIDAEPKKLFHALPVLYITGVLVCARGQRLIRPHACPGMHALPLLSRLVHAAGSCSLML